MSVPTTHEPGKRPSNLLGRFKSLLGVPSMTVETTPHSGHPPTPALQDLDLIMAQVAQKIPLQEVAKRHGVSLSTINRYVRRPEAQEMLDTYRAIIKQTLLERTVQGVVHGAFDVVEGAIKDGNAKDLDAATRAVMNLEKMSASASGEGRKVELTGKDGGPIQVDARAIIADLLAHGTGNR